jgi:hypothetical protein
MLLSGIGQKRTRMGSLAGDAIAFSTALHAYSSGSRSSGRSVKPWFNARIELDGDGYLGSAMRPAPSSFNVIDTSGLADHLGLLNIAAATMPLLSRLLSATLYTGSLLQRNALK